MAGSNQVSFSHTSPAILPPKSTLIARQPYSSQLTSCFLWGAPLLQFRAVCKAEADQRSTLEHADHDLLNAGAM